MTHLSGMEKQRDRARILSFSERGDAIPDALEGKVHHSAADREAVDGEPIDADRQPRAVDMDGAAPAIDAEAEARLQEHERGTRRPGLRQARDGIADRCLAGRASEAAK